MIKTMIVLILLSALCYTCGYCGFPQSSPIPHAHSLPDNMTTFTDDDLKRLKEIQDEANYRFQIDKGNGDPGSDRWVTLAALIARLEAAEANMGGHSGPCENSGGQCICTKGHREIAWRKVAGKS